MTNQHVKAEVGAVKALRSGVTAFSSTLRSTAASAVRETASALQQAKDQLEQRRRRLDGCLRVLQAAERALAQCKENCGGLQQAVAAARRDHDLARRQHSAAQKAVQLIETAHRDLARQASAVANVVQDQGSVASSALADLDAKPRKLPDLGLGATIRHGAMIAGVLAQVAVAASDLAPLAGNFAQAVGTGNAFADPSQSHMVERSEEQAKGFAGDQLAEDAKRRNDSIGRGGRA